MPSDIRHLHLTLPTPAANLACDEAILDDREANAGPGILRFWESRTAFIVVGFANRVAQEVNLAACDRLALPILRRCSGGGTVVQGPGCLNYSLILPLSAAGENAAISGTNRFVMQRHQAAMEALLGQPVSIAGHTDLVTGAARLKFSGNAQRRRRDWFLFHGTFLLDFDLHLIETVLLMPPRQPEYRARRGHREFVTQIPFPADEVARALIRAWGAEPLPDDPAARARLEARIERLVAERYSRDDWNRRW